MTPAEDLKRFEADPKAYLEYRHYVEGILHTASDALYKGTDSALAFQQACYEHMKSKLAKKPEILDSLLPDFSPACRRLTPGPGVWRANCLVKSSFWRLTEGSTWRLWSKTMSTLSPPASKRLQRTASSHKMENSGSAMPSSAQQALSGEYLCDYSSCSLVPGPIQCWTILTNRIK